MYAAAGGASLASRQARQRQRQAKKQQLQAKLHPPKAAAAEAGGASTPTRQSRQFHQLPTNYLRTPQQPAGRKLSASYTTQSRLLLPIDEGGDSQSVLYLRMHSHSHSQTPAGQVARYQPYQHLQQQHQQAMASGAAAQANAAQAAHDAATAAAVASGAPLPPPMHTTSRLIHRHSGSSGSGFLHTHTQLPKSATAMVPLVMQAGVADGGDSSAAGTPATPTGAVAVRAAGLAPYHDAIIVTPATPMASPGHAAVRGGGGAGAGLSPAGTPQADEYDVDVAAAASAAADEDDDEDDREPDDDDEEAGEDEPMQPPGAPLERKCSVYRMRRSDAFEETSPSGDGLLKRQLRDLQQTVQQQYEPLLGDEPQLLFKGLPNGRKWQVCAYCEEGICVCEHIECAQGRAAWLERGRRCSVQESQQQAAACHRRWVKRNRIQDASLGGSSDDEDFLGVLRGPSTFANAFLYVGLGTIALGLVIAFVGTGEKGFKTVELRLIGPSLIGLGLVCCILRILFCICPSHCIASGKKARKKAGNKVDADHTTSLLRGESKRVSIARGPSMQTKYPLSHKRSQSKMINEGMEALRQIATTSLFMQNEQKTPSNRVVPIIKEPERAGGDVPLEMKRLEGAAALHVSAVSSDDDDRSRQRVRRVTMNMDANTTTTTTTTTAVDSEREPPPPRRRPGDGPQTTTTATNTDLVIDISETTTTTATVATNTSLDRGGGGVFPSSSSSSSTTTAVNGKLAKQRVALHKQQQHVEFTHSPSQSLSNGSSAANAEDSSVVVALFMETSLAGEAATGTRSAPLSQPSSAGSTSTVIAIPPPPTCATGAIARTAMPAAATASTSSAAAAPTLTGTTSVYDLLPSATPHTYAAAANTAGLIRGPLGTPLSVLSSYTLSSVASSSNSSATTATPSVAPRPAAAAAASTSTAANAIAMTTFSMTTNAPAPPTLPPAPTTSRAAAAVNGGHAGGGGGVSLGLGTQSQRLSLGGNASLPGQIMETAVSPGLGVAGPSLHNPTMATLAAHSKFEPELVLSPAKLGQ